MPVTGRTASLAVDPEVESVPVRWKLSESPSIAPVRGTGQGGRGGTGTGIAATFSGCYRRYPRTKRQASSAASMIVVAGPIRRSGTSARSLPGQPWPAPVSFQWTTS